MAEIRFKGKDNKKMCVRLKDGMKPILVGRTGKVPVLLPNSSVSRKHCEIRSEGGAYVIEDLKSANGTRVNGQLLKEPWTLQDGDHILCGEVSVFFEEKTGAADKKAAGKGLQKKKAPAASKAPASKKAATKKASTPAKAKEEKAPAKRKAPSKSGSSKSATPEKGGTKEKMLSRAEARLGAVTGDNKGAKDSKGGSDEALEAMESERDEWRAKALAKDSASAKDEAKSLEKDRSKLAVELSQAREQFKKVEQENQDLEERSVRYSMQLESVTEKYREVREELTILKDRLDEEREGRGSQEDQLEDAERNLRLLKEELEELRGGQADRDKSSRELKIKVTERDRTIQQLQEDNAELEYERNEALEESNRLQATFNRDSDETHRMERRLEQLREVIRDKENLVTELRQELEEKDREVISVRMGEGVQGLEDEKQTLMEDFYKKSRDLDAAKDRVTELERDRGELKAEVERLQGSLKDAETVQEGASEERRNSGQKLKDAERSNARLQGKVEVLEGHVVELENTLKEANPDMLRASEAKVKSLAMELAELKKKKGTSRKDGDNSSAASGDILDGLERVEDGFVSLRSSLKLIQGSAKDMGAALTPALEHGKANPDYAETVNQDGIEAAMREFETVRTAVGQETDLFKKELAAFRKLLGG